MSKHVVTLIPGEGTGPEICEAVRTVIDASGVDIRWEYEEIGLDCLEKFGTLLPDKTIQSVAKNRVALKGPTTTPIGTGHKSANVTLRKVFDLYANVRPALSVPALKRPWNNIDILVFRENTEDTYAAIEHMVSSEVAQCLKVITWPGSYRIADFAFRWAIAHGRKKVVCVHKANIMKMTDGLFLDAFREAAKKYPGIETDDIIVDNCAMQLVRNPAQFDCLVLPNLYGDIMTDLCAGMVGGLGFAPGANIGDNCAIFEAVHGSAPKYAGLKKVNPSAVLASGIMMLRWLGETEAAERIDKAMNAVLAEGKRVTYDVGGTASTDDYAQAIVDKMREQN
ncbi:MAG: NAD-dependent isocitrate dehydrogenase [Dethiobacter sp.]|jgi:isocitrate dehydrogenase (NAD+)|nr:NAD-dependent isocitrate dehydrogenase [Dethiobacter sp.]MBS3901510.1 NAD-dependent isocitrate dehydrogenase [Dethiobacter sp.]MBS3989040.1 NAD-dependent isocitrate dehydrogenase [Dethiobacter sp.]